MVTWNKLSPYAFSLCNWHGPCPWRLCNVTRCGHLDSSAYIILFWCGDKGPCYGIAPAERRNKFWHCDPYACRTAVILLFPCARGCHLRLFSQANKIAQRSLSACQDFRIRNLFPESAPGLGGTERQQPLDIYGERHTAINGALIRICTIPVRVRTAALKTGDRILP